MTFDELTSQQSRKQFSRFVRDWNAGRLGALYNLPAHQREQSAGFTKHKWSFASNMSTRDREHLTSAKDSVQAATHSRAGGQGAAGGGAAQTEEGRKMQALLKSMGIQAGTKITIAPRND